MIRTQMYITDDQFKFMQIEAKKLGICTSEFLRRFFEDAMKKYKNETDQTDQG